MGDLTRMCDTTQAPSRAPVQGDTPLLSTLWEQDVFGNQFISDLACGGDLSALEPQPAEHDLDAGVCWAEPSSAGLVAAPPAPAAQTCGPGPATTSTGVSRSDQLGLGSIRSMLNDHSLSPAQRASAMLGYRNQQLPLVDVTAMQAMQANDPAWPLYGSGPDKGLVAPLYEKLGQDPNMQALMTDLADRINAADPDKLDIYEIFSKTQAKSAELAGETSANAGTNLASLQAMATLMNYYKVEKDANGVPQLPPGVDPALWAKIEQAGLAITESTSTDSAVMSHGLQSKPETGKNFVADNNFHFFSHAYLTASLIHEHGVLPHQAEAMSGFIGSQYELLPYSLREGQGNSGLKDILMNAEGAVFGADLMEDPSACLPGKFDGPEPEDRSFPSVSKLDPDTRAIADAAGDLSKTGLILSALQGVTSNKVETDIKVMKQTGLPPAPSGAY